MVFRRLNRRSGWPWCMTAVLQRLLDQSHTVWSSGCYYAYNDTVLSSPDFVSPCIASNASYTNSTIVNCCDVQANNVCMSNSLCYEPGSPDHNYYLSPCTDKTYTAPECPRYCCKCSYTSTPRLRSHDISVNVSLHSS